MTENRSVSGMVISYFYKVKNGSFSFWLERKDCNWLLKVKKKMVSLRNEDFISYFPR